jgi:hypothetical protein
MAHVDRISNLPDPILHNIQEAVRTCVLSKRWERLWASMQLLDLSLPDFKTRRPRVEKRFIRFFNSLLSQRDLSNLHTFRLFCDEDNFNVCHRSMTAWILYAVNHNAKVIKVDGCLYRKLPQDIFTSSSLQELILDISGLGIGIIIARGVNLPRLKKLHLCGIMSRRWTILRNLLSGCPALEDLSLRACSIDMSLISSPQLKYLDIFSGLNGARIESLRAPNLISLCFDLHGDMLFSANFEKTPFLVNASISVHHGTGFDGKCKILSALPNVRNLKLCGSVMKV